MKTKLVHLHRSDGTSQSQAKFLPIYLEGSFKILAKKTLLPTVRNYQPLQAVCTNVNFFLY